MQTGEHEGVPVAGKVNKPAIMNNNRQSCKIISYKLQIIATYIIITVAYKTNWICGSNSTELMLLLWLTIKERHAIPNM